MVAERDEDDADPVSAGEGGGAVAESVAIFENRGGFLHSRHLASAQTRCEKPYVMASGHI